LESCSTLLFHFSPVPELLTITPHGILTRESKMAVSILVLILWVMLACLFGFIEAWIWHFNSRSPMTKTENRILHGMFLIQRSIVFFLSVMIVDKYYTGGFPWQFGLTIWLVFPFFHNGTMYMRRNEINPLSYLDGWCSDPSSTSMAKGNIPYSVRVGCLISGIAIYVIWFFV